MACCSIELSLTNLVFICALLYGAKKLFKLYQKWKLEKMLEKWSTEAPRNKVLLHTVWRGKTMPCISPYGLKLETYLRMAKIPYELETKDMMGPKGKLPWITYNGVHVADSHLSIQFLNKKLGINMNQNHSQEALATARACRVMLEEHFFWGLVQYRLMENAGSMSNLLRLPSALSLLLPLTKFRVKGRMTAAGMGQHTPSEIYQMTEDDLRTISQILGGKKFLGGDEPCEDDCAVFGMVAQAVWALPGSSFERLVHGELKNLKEYCERMKEKYWSDWESCLDKA